MRAFVTHKEARAAGWFSCRHETDEANRQARERWLADRSVQARRERAYARGATRPKERT